MSSATPATVLEFWFEQIEPAQWWRVDAAFDAALRERFGTLHEAAVQGELYAWRADASGRLAEVIVLDQFSRNLHRGSARAFAADPMALALAQEAVAAGHDQALPPARRLFLYLPYMHSESARIHAVAVGLFERLGLRDNLDFELRHKAIIDRFGRYPHRNAALGRVSTEAELAFLREPGSSF
ncbi:MAG: DUF924 domain-containing protein [Dokdonella sp.]|nr:MAG: DUF924 domain-containing protein [Dokdonella sp.]